MPGHKLMYGLSSTWLSNVVCTSTEQLAIDEKVDPEPVYPSGLRRSCSLFRLLGAHSRAVVLNLWAIKGVVEQHFHRGHIRPSEHIYITIHNSKIIVMKWQWKLFYGWGSLQHEEGRKSLLESAICSAEQICCVKGWGVTLLRISFVKRQK